MFGFKISWLNIIFFYCSPHRSSLPDIPLTPREREILEQTKIDVPVLSQLHHSASSDSILGSGSSIRLTETEPPPKPPLPAFRDRINPDRYFNLCIFASIIILFCN